ncbi:NADP-dependent oxidoreductase [Frankia sp. CNm7]|uniref:NADP-dependent oxidoreductase n=1 Tax=Frankia nepalensis TaxID=1836974 RepID=A0A937R6V4_9ACTN|nr:NADP-dependent oxidoreductase [Frankia nepalensis]MBL7499361.1 NADP-dependent oxidoreductase [Frankia nepalensis]MBL7514119.1 NADP-dependent oxidoreductase [Frankia nepalensis]MBL7519234.1 NADP-dependent oxidoreductase [Frankia nepalensis]MBL7626376.1 NADP-dependent oxidoreductase [Frankia nepalensis]
MRALTVSEFGPADLLTITDLPVPEPGRGEVRIRVRAAGVNPVDIYTRNGMAYPVFPVDPPFVLGWEAAGEIDAVGPDVVTWRPGQRVVALSNWFGHTGSFTAGTQAEYVVLPASAVAPAPSTADLAAAATLPLNALTAQQALDAAGLDAGAIVAVTGAAGAVGGFAVQLAAARGLRVVALAGAHDATLVGELGADVAVARSDDPAAAIRRAAPAGVDAVIDAALLGDAVIGAVRDGGTLVVLSGLIDPAPARGIRLPVVQVRADGEELARLSATVDSGGLALRLREVIPLEQAATAHALVEKGGLRGRLVLAL